MRSIIPSCAIFRAHLFTFSINLVIVNGAGPCVGVPPSAIFDGSEWPELWRMSEPYPADRQAANKESKDEDEVLSLPETLASAGVTYQKLDPFGFDYPGVSVPWEPEEGGTNDPVLAKLRDDLNYSYADIITVSGLVDSFWDEHSHADPTIRYIINGSGYFDLRDVNDEWVRMHVKAGDLMEWPAGINHRFTVDDKSFIIAMRLFKGEPVWTSYPRSTILANNTARNNYVDTYLCSDDPDTQNGITNRGDTSLAVMQRLALSVLSLGLAVTIVLVCF